MEAFKSNQETSNSYFTIILLSYYNVVVRFVIHILLKTICILEEFIPNHHKYQFCTLYPSY